MRETAPVAVDTTQSRPTHVAPVESPLKALPALGMLLQVPHLLP